MERWLTVRGAIPAAAVIALGNLFHLLGNGVELGSWSVKRAPSNEIGPIVAFATDPTSTKFFEEAELVGTLGG